MLTFSRFVPPCKLIKTQHCDIECLVPVMYHSAVHGGEERERGPRVSGTRGDPGVCWRRGIPVIGDSGGGAHVHKMSQVGTTQRTLLSFQFPISSFKEEKCFLPSVGRHIYYTDEKISRMIKKKDIPVFY